MVCSVSDFLVGLLFRLVAHAFGFVGGVTWCWVVVCGVCGGLCL